MTDNTPESQGSSPYGQQNQPQYGQNQPQYGQNQPQYGQQSTSPYGQQGQSPYGQQGQYGSGAGNYPGQQGYQGQTTVNPGRTLGIVGFILAILIAPVGLVVSIIAFVQSRKAKMGNGFALAGIIIGAVFTILGAILIAVIASFAADLGQQLIDACSGLPSGSPVTIQGQPTTCP
ncbi:DUF4190 domain-containing protein [Arthrobacter agilis]|jgi:hypothetical protein|uniref:DUF4190 domain-containing protein n=1 Tax=Arthrobacter agilis TaxID=37921 RepID=UPI0027827204|nr:DUF4190 domain-containing protein [Arthrobacter agilis]MDQ0733541.1 hypothetical protein [Arthrobacter agilis]